MCEFILYSDKKIKPLNKYIHNPLINSLIDNCRLQSVPHCSIPGGITRFDLCSFGEGPGRERSSFDLNGCRDAGGRSSDSGVFDDDCIGGTHLISVCGVFDDYDDDDIIYKIISILFGNYDDDYETWIDYDCVNVFWYFLFVCVLLHYIYDDDDHLVY